MGNRAKRRRRRRLTSGLQARMITHFVLAIIGTIGLTSLVFVTYFWIAYIAGENLHREFVVVYRQFERVETVEVEGRRIERRSYESQALPETTRWALVLPPLLVNNFVIATVLAFLALRYSGHFAGPVYRMSTDIRRALAGETGVRIQLRRGDEMRELAQRVNALLEALEHAETRSRDE